MKMIASSHCRQELHFWSTSCNEGSNGSVSGRRSKNTLILMSLPSFQSILPAYKSLSLWHSDLCVDLELLSVDMHLAEDRCLKRHQLVEIKYLMDKFVHDFPEIDTARHHIQMVHSFVHVADSVANYGPLQNYSTVSFENIWDTVCLPWMPFAFRRLVGTTASSVHVTRMHAQVIKHNITILQAATADIERDDFNDSLKLFYTRMRSIHQ